MWTFYFLVAAILTATASLGLERAGLGVAAASMLLFVARPGSAVCFSRASGSRGLLQQIRDTASVLRARDPMPRRSRRCRSVFFSTRPWRPLRRTSTGRPLIDGQRIWNWRQVHESLACPGTSPRGRPRRVQPVHLAPRFLVTCLAALRISLPADPAAFGSSADLTAVLRMRASGPCRRRSGGLDRALERPTAPTLART
jgi:hypothetical protein